MIKMNNFQREPESLVLAEIAAAERVIRSGWYILGNEVAAFETNFANYCETKHCIGVGNGFDALVLIFKAPLVSPCSGNRENF